MGESCVTLLGPQYALLQDEFIHLIPRTPPRIGKIKKILIFFGGSDLHNLTGLAIEAFLKLKRNDIMLDVVISDKNPSFNSIKEQAKEHGNIRLHNILPSLAPLIKTQIFPLEREELLLGSVALGYLSISNCGGESKAHRQ